jgi:hypothetical protein
VNRKRFVWTKSNQTRRQTIIERVVTIVKKWLHNGMIQMTQHGLRAFHKRNGKMPFFSKDEVFHDSLPCVDKSPQDLCADARQNKKVLADSPLSMRDSRLLLKDSCFVETWIMTLSLLD